MVTRRPASLRAASAAALAAGLCRSRPGLVLDRRGYVSSFEQNLVEGVEPADFEADLRQGNGRELDGKFLAAHASSALAVNVFAPFRQRISDLRLPWAGKAAAGSPVRLAFERKCPHGLPPPAPAPHLDVLVESAAGVVAIESKCLEPMSAQHAVFSSAYVRHIKDERRQTSWFGAMTYLTAEPDMFRRLDAAQLVKHAFGLAYTFPDRPVLLVYLYWEPDDSAAHRFFLDHRAEVERFGGMLQQTGGVPSGVRFAAMSYAELWQAWLRDSPPPWLVTHVTRLRARYGVTVGSA